MEILSKILIGIIFILVTVITVTIYKFPKKTICPPPSCSCPRALPCNIQSTASKPTANQPSDNF